MITNFFDLDVYKESFQLSLEIEELLKTFPDLEKFLLTDQMRRASRSIPAQIAEGYARREALKDFQKSSNNQKLKTSSSRTSHFSFQKFNGPYFLDKENYLSCWPKKSARKASM